MTVCIGTDQVNVGEPEEADVAYQKSMTRLEDPVILALTLDPESQIGIQHSDADTPMTGSTEYSVLSTSFGGRIPPDSIHSHVLSDSGEVSAGHDGNQLTAQRRCCKPVPTIACRVLESRFTSDLGNAR